MGTPPSAIVVDQKNSPTKTTTDDNTKTSLEPSSSSGLSHNGFDKISPILQLSEIEMIAIQSASYTSLKDLLQPPSILSPTPHNSSWQEIPIKNPLVKHAALAYLQPMSTPLEVGDPGFFRRLKDQFFGQCGCLGWFSDVFWKPLRSSFWQTREEIEYEDQDEKLDGPRETYSYRDGVLSGNFV